MHKLVENCRFSLKNNITTLVFLTFSPGFHHAAMLLYFGCTYILKNSFCRYSNTILTGYYTVLPSLDISDSGWSTKALKPGHINSHICSQALTFLRDSTGKYCQKWPMLEYKHCTVKLHNIIDCMCVGTYVFITDCRFSNHKYY